MELMLDVDHEKLNSILKKNELLNYSIKFSLENSFDSITVELSPTVDKKNTTITIEDIDERVNRRNRRSIF